MIEGQFATMIKIVDLLRILSRLLGSWVVLPWQSICLSWWLRQVDGN